MKINKVPTENKNSIKIKIWVRMLIAIIIIGIFSGMGYLLSNLLLNNNQQAKVIDTNKPQDKVSAEIGPVSKTIKITGHLIPCQQESIPVENGATIDNIYYEVGCRVEKGYKLIDITTNSIKNNIADTNNIQSATLKESIALIAHINGKIEEVNIKNKQVVTDTEKPAMLIIDDSSYIFQANINETDIINVSTNQTANIKLKAFPDIIFTGKVKQISAVGTVNKNNETFYNAQIVLNKTNPNFKIGMTGEADLFIENKTDVLRLPLDVIILTGNNKGEVNILNESNTLIKKEVSVGIIGNEFVEITDGLVEKQEVFAKKILNYKSY